ncbi:uncharacterized protein LOC143226867 [Tachypleus tridentatus]|uniref:uncharacterized protein LOC143226867 n=1 Tax=Tachypleus tridentatus TaxID=6853 RepID=UPI003FCF63E9
MEILKMGIEAFSDEKKDDLLDIKWIKMEDETSRITSIPADSLEESSLCTVMKFDITREEQEEKCDVTSDKSENVYVQVKIEQPADLLQDDVVSKFSYSDDEDQDGSCYNVMNVKTETEFKRYTESGLERVSDIKTSVNTCYGSQVPGYHVIKQEGNVTGDVKSPNNNISGETKLGINNLTAFNIYQNDDVPYSCGKIFDKLKQQKRIHSGEKLYHCTFCGKQFDKNSYIIEHQRPPTGKKTYSCRVCGKQFQTNAHSQTDKGDTSERNFIPVGCVENSLEQRVNQKYMKDYTLERNLTVVQSVENSLVQIVF